MQAKLVFEGANTVTHTALGQVERLAQRVSGRPCICAPGSVLSMYGSFVGWPLLAGPYWLMANLVRPSHQQTCTRSSSGWSRSSRRVLLACCRQCPLVFCATTPPTLGTSASSLSALHRHLAYLEPQLLYR